MSLYTHHIIVVYNQKKNCPHCGLPSEKVLQNLEGTGNTIVVEADKQTLKKFVDDDLYVKNLKDCMKILQIKTDDSEKVMSELQSWQNDFIDKLLVIQL